MATRDCKFQTTIPKEKWFPSWKLFYAQLTQGRSIIDPSILKEELTKNKSQLLQGFGFRQEDTKLEHASLGWALPYEDIGLQEKKKKQTESSPTIAKLSNILNIEEETCEKVLISYFEHEFVGTSEEVNDVLSITSQDQDKLVDIVLYFIHEKSFFVKCWKMIVSYIFDPEHMYHFACKDFIESQDANYLYSFFIKQLELNQDIGFPSDTHHQSEVFKAWVNQTMNSQVDILSCLIYVLDLKPTIEYKDIRYFLSCCKETSFGGNHLNTTHSQSTYTDDWRTYASYMYCLHLVQLLLDSNCDWNNKQFNEIFQDIKAFDIDQNPCVVPIVFFNWIVFLIRINHFSDEENLLKYSQQVFQLKPWGKLKTVLESEVITVDKTFQSFIMKKVSAAVCEMITYLDMNVLEFENQEIFKLISLFSKYNEVISSEEVEKVISYGLDMFPGRDASILHLYIPLMDKSKEDCTQCLEKLLAARYFNWKSVDVPMTKRNDAFFSACSFCPFEYAQNVVIPEGTLCQQSESGFDYYQWENVVPVWSIMKEELTAYCMALSDDSFVEQDGQNTSSFLCSSIHGKVPHQKYLRPSLESGDFRSRIVTYLKLIGTLVKYPSLLDEHMGDILDLVSQMFQLNTADTRQYNPDVEIVAFCLNIATNMYPGVTSLYNQSVHVLPQVLAIPDVDNAHEMLSSGRFLNGNSLKRFLKTGKMSGERVDLLDAYLGFLAKLSEHEACIENSAYAHGLLFVTLEVFPACLTSWQFQHEKQRRHICLSALKLITNFLNTFNPALHNERGTSVDILVPPSYTRIAQAVLHAIVEGACGQLLVEIASLGESFLLNAFLETPSSLNQLPPILDIVYFTLVILNKVLHLKKEMGEHSEKSSLVIALEKPRLIQSVISYVQHSHKGPLRLISLSVLRRIVENRHINLNISSEQVRVLCLQPLLSHSESAQFKITLLQFCEQCLETQPTLACMLLDVENEDDKCSLLHFVLDYMKNMNDVNNPLHYWVLAVFHTIWKKEMFIVRSKIIQDPLFWRYLCEGLHKSPSLASDAHVFSPVFNIVSTELYWMSNDSEHPLFTFVTKFFSNEANLREWSETCTNVEHSGEKLGMFHQLSISWQEFLVVVCKYRPSVLTEEVKNILLSDVLDAVHEHLACIDSRNDIQQSFHALNSLGLVLLNSWGVAMEYTEVKVNKACQLIVLLAKQYECLSIQSDILFLAFIAKLFNIICSTSTKICVSAVLEFPGFLNALGIVFRHALDNFKDSLITKSKTIQLISVIIPFIIEIQSVLDNQTAAWISTLQQHNIFFTVYQCILESVRLQVYSDTSSFLVEYLIHCVLGDYFHHMDKVSLVSVIEEMTPQSNIRETDKNYISLNSYGISFVYTQDDYNIFYNQFINLLIVLLRRCDHSLKRQVFNYIIVNHETFVCLYKYAGLALTQRNLNFVLSCLNLILEMTNHRVLVEELTRQYFIRLVQNITICMNTTVDLLEKEELTVAVRIFPQEAFDECLECKVYSSKLRTEAEKTSYCCELKMILASIYQTCVTVYNKFNVEFGLILTCARVGYLPWEIHNIIPHVSVEHNLVADIAFCDFTIIIRCLKSHMKLLTHKHNADLLDKIRASFEMTLHLLINHSLLFLLNPYNSVKDKHVLLRDIELNLAYIIEYVKKNNGVTILPFTKHWSKSPRKYFVQKELKLPNIKLKLKKEQHVLTWGDAACKTQCVQRLFPDEEEEERSSYEIEADMEYMQFMVQLFSQVCSLAGDTI